MIKALKTRNLTPGSIRTILREKICASLFFKETLWRFSGAFLLIKIKKWRSEAIACLTISLAFFIFIACFYAWHGGSAAGPRYLLPAYPFAFFLTVFALKKFPKTYITLGAFSIIINLSITLVGNEIPREIKNPLANVVWSNLLKGNVSINPIPFSNFNNYPNIDKLSDVKNWAPSFNSFNLGEFFFPNQIASLLPLLCFWMIWALVWLKYSKQPKP